MVYPFLVGFFIKISEDVVACREKKAIEGYFWRRLL